MINVSMKGRAIFEREGITLDFSAWPGRNVSDVTLKIEGLRIGDQYSIEALIDDAVVARSFSVEADGSGTYHFGFPRAFAHFNQPIGIRIRNDTHGNVGEIRSVETTDGRRIAL